MKIHKRYKALNIILLSLILNVSYSQITKSVEFKVFDLERNTIAKNGVNYDCIKLRNGKSSTIFGNPDLPIFHYRFYIPVTQKAIGVTFSSKKQDVIHLTNKLVPAQKPILTSLNGQDSSFIQPNKQVYDNNLTYPQIQARITDTDYLDGNLQIITVEVSPMQYFSDLKKIVFSSQFDLIIETAVDDNLKGKKVPPKKRMKEAMSILKSLVENPETVSSDSSSIIKQSTSSTKVISKVGSATNTTLPYYEYVIITDASLVSGFADFVNWKKRKGIDIGIVTTNDIYSNYIGDNISSPAINDNPGKVRQYLKDAKTNGSTIWALIAGDYNTNVPIKIFNYYGEAVPTDSYFSDLHGNWSNNAPLVIPDIFVGRLICANITDIQNWSKKVLLYEQNPGNGDPEYLAKAFSVQADEMQDGNQATDVFSYFKDIYGTPNFTTHTVFGETTSSSSLYNNDGLILPGGTVMGTNKGADVVNELNSNHYGLISWYCHGGTGGQNSGIVTMSSGAQGFPQWKLDAQDAFTYHTAQPEINNGLDNLNNSNYPCLLYSISCHVTPYDKTSNNGNNGAMNSGEAFTKLPQTGGVAFLGNTVNGWVYDSYKIYRLFATLINSDDYHSHLGVSESISKYSYGYTYLAYSHNLIGCPETQMWTAVPTKFSNATVVRNGSSVTVNTGNISNCKICVISANDNGNSYFEVYDNVSSYTFSNVPVPYHVTITKHNYIPHIYSSDYYMQNETYSGTQTINATNVNAGSSVTTIKPIGPVIIQSGAYITINADGNTIINDTFEVQSGAQLEVK
jgi:hypothetical protein